MLSRIFSELKFLKRIVSLADAVTYHRPKPLREFDQIYMMSGDMLAQTELIRSYVNGKRLLFLGDGDGMSMLFGLLASKGELEPPRQMVVLDFDKRILSNIERFAVQHGFKRYNVILETAPYNVIDAPIGKYIGVFDFFYVNPPYGSKNNGISTIVWLERCLEFCTYSCSGCLVIPYDDKESWSQEAMLNIQRFLSEKGFVVRDMVSNMHYYHLKDNPVLQSATIIVDRVERHDSTYAGKEIPIDLLKNLYGSPIKIPHYIEIADPDLLSGTPDYNWTYGEEFWIKREDA